MVVIKSFGISLTRGAVVDDHIFPATLFHLGVVDRRADGWREIPVFRAAAEKSSGLFRRWDEPLVFGLAGFLDYDRSIGARGRRRSLGFGSRTRRRSGPGFRRGCRLWCRTWCRRGAGSRAGLWCWHLVFGRLRTGCGLRHVVIRRFRCRLGRCHFFRRGFRRIRLLRSWCRFR